MMTLTDVYCRFNRARGMEVCVGLCGSFCVNCIITGAVDRSNFFRPCVTTLRLKKTTKGLLCKIETYKPERYKDGKG